MRRIVVAYLFFQNLNFLIAGSLFSDSLGKVFKSPDLENYLDLYQQGNKGAELYYNIALAYERNLDYPRAILFAEKALRWDPSCKICKVLLSRVQQKADLNVFSLPGFSFFGHYRSIVQFLPALYWFGLASLLLCVFVFVHLRRKEVLLKYVLLFCALVCMINSAMFEYLRNQSGYYILMTSSALHWSPDATSKVKTEMSAGMKLKEMDRIGEWGKFRTPEYDEGWIPLSLVEKIE